MIVIGSELTLIGFNKIQHEAEFAVIESNRNILSFKTNVRRSLPRIETTEQQYDFLKAVEFNLSSSICFRSADKPFHPSKALLVYPASRGEPVFAAKPP